MAKSDLSFYGSSCTRDCSGHNSGWKWRRDNPTSTVKSPSSSFVAGAAIRDLQMISGTNLIGTAARNIRTGKFQKIIKGR